ncbi:alpha/beta hydrolase-fold protein [Actinosynnema sp. NPDC059797]
MRRFGVLSAVLALLVSVVAPAEASGVRQYEGEIDGARYRVVVPGRWNGTLVLWSHGAYGVEPATIAVTDRPETEQHLLDRGYALGASLFRTPVGWSAEDGLRDQVRLLDWFEREVGTPRRTVSAGESIGGATSIVLAERNPDRFHGVLSLCGATAGGAAYWNSGLDAVFALSVLLGVDVDLVRAADPAANEARLVAAVTSAAAGGPAARARLALAGALADVPGWFDPAAPRPGSLDERLDWVAVWLRYFRAGAAGPGRADLERWAGGNPSWNAGVDYRRVLRRSDQRELVDQAYAAAGVDLAADLDRLAAAPRVAPDPAAVAYLARTSLPVGRTPWPVLTVHNAGDGLLPPSNGTAYAERVRQPERLRQYAVDRAGHCRFSAAEEITAFRVLFERVETGRWPAAGPAAMNAEAAALGPAFHLTRSPLTGGDVVVEPAFTRLEAGPYPRSLPF